MWCVSINVGCGGPLEDLEARIASMSAWVADVLRAGSRKPDLVFAQETDPEWIAVWEAAEYRAFVGGPPTYRCRSALLVSRGIWVEQLTHDSLPSLAYHGSYVAAARMRLLDGRTQIAISAHASPAFPDDPAMIRSAADWPADVPAPARRQVGTAVRYAGELWDSDRVLATAVHAREEGGPVLMAGDLNEARGWDVGHPGTWGEEYFRNATTSGLFAPLHERWDGERPTRWSGPDDQAPLQLDHVLATADLAAKVTRGHVDERWSNPQVAFSEGLSDHAPVWFWLEPEWTSTSEHGVTVETTSDPAYARLVPHDEQEARATHRFEGGNSYTVEDGASFYVITDEGTMLDFLDKNEWIPWVTVRRFESESDRDKWIRSR